MRRLQIYINQYHQLVPPIADLAAYESLPPEHRFTLRDAVYEHPKLLSRFVSENPCEFFGSGIKNELNLIKASLELGECAVTKPNDQHTISRAMEKVDRAFGKACKSLYY